MPGGQRFLDLSATGSDLTEYHVEAAIAWVHATAISAEETDWKHIVSLYDLLMRIRPSPVVALNRAIAIGQHEGPTRGLEEIHVTVDRARLANYPFYFAALGEFEFRNGKYDVSQEQFRKALAVARNPMEREFLQKRIVACEQADAGNERWQSIVPNLTFQSEKTITLGSETPGLARHFYHSHGGDLFIYSRKPNSSWRSTA